MKVINMRQTGSYVIYSIGLDQTPNEMWHVFYCDIEMEFNCSCMKMESFVIPCEHIVCVLVHEDIEELPRSLVLPRWTKTAKPTLLAKITRDDVQVNASGAGLATNDLGHSMPRDPRKCRTKCGASQSNKRKHRCGQCGMEGHNRTTCCVHRGISHLEGRRNDTFDNDLDDHMNIEDDSLLSIFINEVVISKKSSHNWQKLEIHPKKWSGGVRGSFESCRLHYLVCIYWELRHSLGIASPPVCGSQSLYLQFSAVQFSYATVTLDLLAQLSVLRASSKIVIM
ncbi:hypothetical protein AHAS_Ahas01G0145800 [Arachis hypogaea]